MRSAVLAIMLLFIGFYNRLSAQDAPVETKDTVISSVEIDEHPVKAGTFSTISQTAPVEARTVPQEKVEALQKSDDYWYANLQPKKKEVKLRKKGLLDQEWFWKLLWILALSGFIAVVIWYLASSNISLFRKKSKAVAEGGEEEAVTDDIFSINYDKEIRKAEEAANYRLAVRLWYLRTLKELAGRSIINYRAEKPNGDYLNALYGGPHYHDFFRLTRGFEYTWYGQFPLSEDHYKTMQTEFLNFKNSLFR